MSASENVELSLEPIDLVENESGSFGWSDDDSAIDPLVYSGVEPASPSQIARMKDEARRPLKEPKDFTDDITKKFRDSWKIQSKQTPDEFAKTFASYLAKSDGHYEVRSNKELRRRERGTATDPSKFAQGQQYTYGDGQARNILYVLVFPFSLSILTD